jgi:protein-L-isoaspartate(D-aspartate) O-methyltransferase
VLASRLRARGIRDERVLAAIARLEREQFVPGISAEEAQRDEPLHIGFGQTISQPYIVAYMTEVLALRAGERILEIGAGSGYQAAVFAELGAEVYTIEVVHELAQATRERLGRLGYRQIHLREGDGSKGWPEEAPFDAIVLTAAPEKIPEPLLWQLKPGGRLLAPVGPQEDLQYLVLVRRDPETGEAAVERLLSVRFVPLTHPAAPE